MAGARKEGGDTARPRSQECLLVHSRGCTPSPCWPFLGVSVLPQGAGSAKAHPTTLCLTPHQVKAGPPGYQGLPKTQSGPLFTSLYCGLNF